MVIAAVLSARAPGESAGPHAGMSHSQPFLVLSTASSGGARPSSPARTLSSIMPVTPTIAGAMSRRHAASEGSATSGGHPGALEHRGQVGQLARQPAERVSRQVPLELPVRRVPAVELRVVVGAVEAAGLAVHRLEQVDAPDRPADPDRHGGVDRPLEVAPVEHPQFEPNPMLGALLSLARVRGRGSTGRRRRRQLARRRRPAA